MSSVVTINDVISEFKSETEVLLIKAKANSSKDDIESIVSSYSNTNDVITVSLTILLKESVAGNGSLVARLLSMINPGLSLFDRQEEVNYFVEFVITYLGFLNITNNVDFRIASALPLPKLPGVNNDVLSINIYTGIEPLFKTLKMLKIKQPFYDLIRYLTQPRTNFLVYLNSGPSYNDDGDVMEFCVSLITDIICNIKDGNESHNLIIDEEFKKVSGEIVTVGLFHKNEIKEYIQTNVIPKLQSDMTDMFNRVKNEVIQELKYDNSNMITMSSLSITPDLQNEIKEIVNSTVKELNPDLSSLINKVDGLKNDLDHLTKEINQSDSMYNRVDNLEHKLNDLFVMLNMIMKHLRIK